MPPAGQPTTVPISPLSCGPTWGRRSVAHPGRGTPLRCAPTLLCPRGATWGIPRSSTNAQKDRTCVRTVVVGGADRYAHWRVELGRPRWVRCPLPRPCRGERRLHRAPANSVVTLKSSSRHAGSGVTANRGKLLDSGRLPRGQGCATCRVWRRRGAPTVVWIRAGLVQFCGVCGRNFACYATALATFGAVVGFHGVGSRRRCSRVRRRPRGLRCWLCSRR